MVSLNSALLDAGTRRTVQWGMRSLLRKASAWFNLRRVKRDREAQRQHADFVGWTVEDLDQVEGWEEMESDVL